MVRVVKKIKPTARVKARIRLPGSKSITHRALLMAALAEGESIIRNPLMAEDTLLTANALRQLGVEINWEKDEVHLTPPGNRWKSPKDPIWLGNSGTSMRLLLAVAAAGSGRFIFDGSPRLRERPVGPILKALEELGVKIKYLEKKGYPPVEIVSEGLLSGELVIDASQSSQFLSALLIAGPCAHGPISIEWSKPVASFPYVRLTLDMMELTGVSHQWLLPHKLAIPAPQSYKPLQFQVEGDCSSASYFWAAAALTGGDVYTFPLSPSAMQGDCLLVDVLEQMGCQVEWDDEGVRIIGSGELAPVDLDMNAMPDMVPTVAVLASFAQGRSIIKNVGHLRIKESDRLSVVASELSKLGVKVEELPDGLIIDGGVQHGASIDAHDDHRIAMAFALAGIRVEGVEIDGAEAVAKSFPSFWEAFERLYQER
jgi:3-phosphoshikimate 1-carboxyvinyltransferase